MDADHLVALTGIRKPIIVSTLFMAAERGMVNSVSKSQAVPAAAAGERCTRRGQLYTFVSYQPTEQAVVTPGLSDDAATGMSELVDFCLGQEFRARLACYDAISTPRRISLAGFD